MEALKTIRFKFSVFNNYRIVLFLIISILMILMMRLWFLLTTTVTISLNKPNTEFLDAHTPAVIIVENNLQAKPTNLRRIEKIKILTIKSPSILRSNDEYLAYSQFKQLDSLELKISRELELANTLVTKKENLITWTEFVGRPIFGNGQNLMSFIDHLKNSSENLGPVVEDRVNVAQSAAQEKADLEEIVEYNLASEADSEETQGPINPFISRPGVSNRVDNVIDRLMSAIPTNFNKNNVIRPPKRQTIKESYWVEISLNSLDKLEADSGMDDFEFNPMFNQDEVTQSDNGSVRIENNCASKCGNLEGKITAQGMADVYIKVPLKSKSNFKQLVLTMTEKDFQKIYEDNSIAPDSGVLIINMNDKVLNIDLDRNYKYKKMFNKSGEVTEVVADAKYLLIAGVDAGPVTLSYQLENGWALDMIGVRSQSLTYLNPEFINEQQGVATFLLQDTLSSKSRPLELGTNSIKSFDKYEEITQVTYNQFNFKNNYSIKGYRNYRQVIYSRNGVFSAHQFEDDQSLNEILLPSQEFKRVVSDYLSANEEDGQCIIQVNNMDNRLESISVQQVNFRNEFEPSATMSLDEEGTFSSEISASTKNIFLNSDTPGTIHLKLNYLDGKTRYLNTFCIKGTYLVEHL
jgi:hypothetical protein